MSSHVVTIGHFRNKLSAYLQEVRRGNEIVIADRQTPIGRLSPYAVKADPDWLIQEPSGSYGKLKKLSYPRCKTPVSAVETLLAERRSR